MQIMVLNCGSSSLKYSVLALPGEREIARGEAQRVGPRTAEPARIVHRGAGAERTVFADMPDHATAFDRIVQVLDEDDVASSDVIAHRIVHGGKHFAGSVEVDSGVERALSDLNDLAPIHNPPAVALVGACRSRHPEVPQVLVFDTSYHNTIPDAARTYALPETLRVEHGLRKYGFHGISHQYVVGEAAAVLRRPPSDFNAVSCHLGSGGASLCAVKGGRSVDSTMGYTPLQGLVMSTRCGDLDPAVTLQMLARQEGDAEAVERTLNRTSGVLGLSGASADIRDVIAGASDGLSGLTAQAYLWRLRKYLGSYLTLVAPAHAVVFTDTIGETVPAVRAAACGGLEGFGVELDPVANAGPGPLPADVAASGSRVRVLVVATNEELAIARDAFRLLTSSTSTAVEGAWS